MLFGTLSGSMLPLLLQRAGIDPAISSAPFIATLVDVTGLVIYFSLAYLFLKGLLLLTRSFDLARQLYAQFGLGRIADKQADTVSERSRPQPLGVIVDPHTRRIGWRHSHS